jgi:hypothetical protein
MQMELRVHRSPCEKGEFLINRFCDLTEFTEVFSDYTQKVYSKYAFTLENPQIAFYLSNLKGQYLFIEHIAQDGYSVKYIDTIKKMVFTNNIYETIVLEKIPLFFSSKFEQLMQGMKTEVYKDSVADSFNEGNFLYNYKPRHKIVFVYELMVSIIGPILLFLFFNDIPIYINLFFSSFYPVAFIVQIFYQINYIKESKRLSIKVSKCNPKVEGTLDGRAFSFLKEEIKEVTVYYHHASKSFGYGNYWFTRIVLIENSIINIPDMVIDTEQIPEKFHGIKIIQKNVNFPYIKHKSRISPRAGNF